MRHFRRTYETSNAMRYMRALALTNNGSLHIVDILQSLQRSGLAFSAAIDGELRHTSDYTARGKKRFYRLGLHIFCTSHVPKYSEPRIFAQHSFSQDSVGCAQQHKRGIDARRQALRASTFSVVILHGYSWLPLPHLPSTWVWGGRPCSVVIDIFRGGAAGGGVVVVEGG